MPGSGPSGASSGVVDCGFSHGIGCIHGGRLSGAGACDGANCEAMQMTWQPCSGSTLSTGPAVGPGII
jgi:hypothetical protein